MGTGFSFLDAIFLLPYAYSNSKSWSVTPVASFFSLRKRKILASNLSRALSVLGKASFKGYSSFIDDASTADTLD